MSPSIEPFNEVKYKALMDGLDCSEILLSALERTARIDAEFYRKGNLEISDFLKKKVLQPFTASFSVSDGNHMSISDAFCDEGIPYYRGQDIYNVFIEEASPVCIDGDTYNHPHMKRSHLKCGDVLMSIVGAIVGNSSIVTSNADATCSCKLAIMRSMHKEILPEMLLIFIKTKYGQNQIQKFKRGAAQTGLLLEDFDQLSIPVFSFTFQQAIKDLVNDAHIAMAGSVTAYNDAERTLMKELTFNPAKVNSESVSRRLLSDSFHMSGRLDAEYYQPKYDDYHQVICSYSKGYSTVGKEFKMIKTKCDRTEDSYPYVEIGDVNINAGFATSNTIDTTELPDNAKILTQLGDVVVSTVRPNRGAVAILEEPDLLVSGAFTVLRETGSYRKEVLQVLLRTDLYRAWLLRYNVGTSYPVIKDDDVLNMPLPLFPDFIQQGIANLVNKAHDNRSKASFLIKLAVRAVETAIEKDETAAIDYIGKEQICNV